MIEQHTLQTWHQRLGHINRRDILHLENGAAEGIKIGTPTTTTSSPIDCTSCLIGKQHSEISRMLRAGLGKRLGIIQIDICRPMQVDGYVQGHKYAAVIVDEETKFTHTYFLKTKDGLRDAIKDFIAKVEYQCGEKVLSLHSDNKLVLLETVFQRWLRSRGSTHTTIQTY